MNTYRITLHLRSGIVTPLSADTLWGHVCWGLRWRQGESALEEWLARYDDGDPPLVLSDPMPAGHLPVPHLPPPMPASRPPTEAESAAHKSASKRQWMRAADWSRIAAGVNADAVRAALAGDPTRPGDLELEEASILHAAINRLTGGTAQEGGGTLYAVPQSYARLGCTSFDVFTVTTHDSPALRTLFEDGLVGGYGRDGATGLGQLVVGEIAPWSPPSIGDADAVMLLGPCVPRAGDPHHGFHRFGVRCGRLGGDYAISGPRVGRSKQKRAVHVLERGTILCGSGLAPLVLGRVVRGVHEDDAIRHSGLTIGLPCRLTPELRDAAAPRARIPA